MCRGAEVRRCRGAEVTVNLQVPQSSSPPVSNLITDYCNRYCTAAVFIRAPRVVTILDDAKDAKRPAAA
jgi:glutamine amidotransferase PdxT